MGATAICSYCKEELPLTVEHFHADLSRAGGFKSQCRGCRSEGRAVVERALESGEGLLRFGSPIEQACMESLLVNKTIRPSARFVGLSPREFRGHLAQLCRKAAVRGFAPADDMTQTTPEGFSVSAVSSYYRVNKKGEHELSAQWVKTKQDEQRRVTALLEAMTGIADAWKGMADPVPAGKHHDDDLLCVYPMGDPHIGMYAWADEAGDNFNLDIAEQGLCGAVDQLVAGAPPAGQALIVSLGDYFHADNHMAVTMRSGNHLDVDSRWSKVMRVGIRAMRRCIDRALEKHASVRVICEIGNHDDHSSVMLALCLEQYYEREPRVEVDTSPSRFHWHRFGVNLIGVTHGDTAKLNQLPAIMACDRKEDWGETEFRYWYTGHVHHDSTQEFPGVVVETFRTLAPRDAWAAAAGYRAGRDAKVDVVHRRFGRIQRNTVGIQMLPSGK